MNTKAVGSSRSVVESQKFPVRKPKSPVRFGSFTCSPTRHVGSMIDEDRNVNTHTAPHQQKLDASSGTRARVSGRASALLGCRAQPGASLAVALRQLRLLRSVLGLPLNSTSIRSRSTGDIPVQPVLRHHRGEFRAACDTIACRSPGRLDHAGELRRHLRQPGHHHGAAVASTRRRTRAQQAAASLQLPHRQRLVSAAKRLGRNQPERWRRTGRERQRCDGDGDGADAGCARGTRAVSVRVLLHVQTAAELVRSGCVAKYLTMPRAPPPGGAREGFSTPNPSEAAKNICRSSA